jgi:catechol 2,3-dioxygenase-like lactoylglutathione lyase family enzyme
MTQSFLGWRTVGFKVSDLAAAKQWYTQVLGFEPYFDQPFYVGYNVGGYELGLMPSEGELIHGNTIEAYLGVDDAASSYARLLELGATERAAPQDVGDGILVATVADPFGNILGIIQNPHFKAA